jgi:hypothetical protein
MIVIHMQLGYILMRCCVTESWFMPIKALIIRERPAAMTNEQINSRTPTAKGCHRYSRHTVNSQSICKILKGCVADTKHTNNHNYNMKINFSRSCFCMHLRNNVCTGFRDGSTTTLSKRGKLITAAKTLTQTAFMLQENPENV